MSLEVFAHKVKALGYLLRPNQLKYAVLLITNRCNLSCPYCQIRDSAKRELSLTEWKLVIDRLLGWGVAYFNISGGEPFLRDDVEALVQYIVSNNRVATVTSNGTLITEEKVDRLSRSGLSVLTLSADSQDGFGKGDFDKVISILARARARGIIPVLHCVITSENINCVLDLASRTVKSGIFFSCCLYQAIGGIQSRREDSLIPELCDVEQIFSVLKDIKRRTGMVKTSYDYMDNLRRYSMQGWHCHSTNADWIAVDSDGSLLACCERSTDVSLFDVKTIPGERWDQLREWAVKDCPGCYYECYFTEGEVYKGNKLLREVPSVPGFWLNSLYLLLANFRSLVLIHE